MYDYQRDAIEKKYWAALMSLPINSADRNKLRDVVKGDAKKLAARAAKYLSMSAEYAERRAFDKKRGIIEPLKLPNPVTRQSPCLPFESGKNCLPGMQEWLDRMNSRAADDAEVIEPDYQEAA